MVRARSLVRLARRRLENVSSREAFFFTVDYYTTLVRTFASLGRFRGGVARLSPRARASARALSLAPPRAPFRPMPSADRAGGLACVAASLFGLLLIVVVFTQGYAAVKNSRNARTHERTPPAPLYGTHGVSPRRALRQIQLERDLAPGGFTQIAPGTSGASPNTWLKDAFATEVPATLHARASLEASNALDRSRRNFDRVPAAAFEAWGALMRYYSVGGSNTYQAWLVPPALWPSFGRK